MKLPFWDRYIKIKHSVDMEEITDKTLREFLRSPQEDYIQISEAIGAREDETKMVMEQLEQNAPVFYRMAALLQKESDDAKIVGETGVILPYLTQLREIAQRQQLDEEEWL